MSKEEIYRDFYETIKERVESGLPIWKEALLDCIKENEAALKEVEKEQPKLRIPKKIADMLDYCFENEGGYEDVGYIVSNVDLLPEPDYAVYYEWLEETDDNKNYNLALAYLAGKALGVELVEVIDE